MSEQTRKQVNYTVSCIHEFARRKKISQRDAYLFLQQYQGISFLNEFYDVEHTLSMNDAMDDLETVCRKNGGVQTADESVFISYRARNTVPTESRYSEMSKAELLIEYITQDIVSRLMEEENLSMEEALNQFYTSQTFSKLIDQETGLYLDASASVYALYQDEQEAGELVQNEI